MRTLEQAEAVIKMFEQNGPAKLYYALNKKMNEMGDILNNQNLSSLDLADPKDKRFERLKTIWSDAADIAAAVKSLGELAGVTNDEAKDIARKPFVDLIAEKRY